MIVRLCYSKTDNEQNIRENCLPNLEDPNTYPNQILSIFLNILRKYSASHATHDINPIEIGEASAKKCCVVNIKHRFVFDDTSKNGSSNIENDVAYAKCDTKESSTSDFARAQTDGGLKQRSSDANRKIPIYASKSTETDNCNCNIGSRCSDSDCSDQGHSLRSVHEAFTSMHSSVDMRDELVSTKNLRLSSQKVNQEFPTCIMRNHVELETGSSSDKMLLFRSHDATYEDEEQFRLVEDSTNHVTANNGNAITQLCCDKNELMTKLGRSECNSPCPNVESCKRGFHYFPFNSPDTNSSDIQRAEKILFHESDISTVSLFISCDIWKQRTARTAILKCTKLDFNFSFIYRISNLFDFFDYVLNESVVFQANILPNNSESHYVAAKATLCIDDILDYPHKELFYNASMKSILPCSQDTNFGLLSLWFRLSCNDEKIDSFNKQYNFSEIYSDLRLSQKMTIPPKLERRLGKENVIVHSEETIGSGPPSSFVRNSLSAIEESLETIVDDESVESTLTYVNQNPKIKKVSIFERISDSTYADSEESNLKKSLEMESLFNKDEEEAEEATRRISSVEEFNSLRVQGNQNASMLEDPNMADINNLLSDTNWEKFRNRGPDSISPVEKDTIEIEVVSVSLFEKSVVMRDNEIRLLYVEYHFLGNYGADMETESVEKPSKGDMKMVFNFRKEFPIDEEHHANERKTLRAMLAEILDPNIHFFLVSEPLPEENNIKECVEIGIAHFNVRKYALEDSFKCITLPVFSMNKTEQIGQLEIYVLGIDAIRECLGENEKFQLEDSKRFIRPRSG